MKSSIQSFLTFLKCHPTHNKERNLLRKRIKIYYLLGLFLRGESLNPDTFKFLYVFSISNFEISFIIIFILPNNAYLTILFKYFKCLC